MFETGSAPMTVNKKDGKYIGLLFLYTMLGTAVTFVLENATDITAIIPVKYVHLFNLIAVPAMGFLYQWIADNRKKIEDDAKNPPSPPAPPMIGSFMIFFLIVMVSTPLQAQILGAGEKDKAYPVYSLVRLKCEKEGTSYVWIIRRLPDGFRPESVRLGNGQELVWTGPPGNYDIDAIFTDSTGSLQQIFGKVVIGDGVPTPTPAPTPLPGPNPQPTPGPTPIPNPTPGPSKPLPRPSSSFGYAEFAYDQAMKIPENERKLAGRFGENYVGISASMFAGGIVDVQKGFTELKSRNVELKSDPSFPAWNDFFVQLQSRVDTDWRARKFSNREQVATVFREIGEGLFASIGRSE